MPLALERILAAIASRENIPGTLFAANGLASGPAVVSVTQSPRFEAWADQRDPFLRDHFGGDSLGHESLDHIAHFDVAVVGNRDAALHAVADFAGIIFEAAQ